MSIVTLIEASPRDGTGAPLTVRLAGGGRRGYTHLGKSDWRAGISSQPRFTSLLGFDESGWTSGAVPQAAALDFDPADPALLASLSDRIWFDAPITVWVGDDTTGVFSVRLKGSVAAHSVAAGVLTLTFADMSDALAKPMITDRFGGTGGLDGSADAKDRIKRRSWGRVFNVEGRLFDKASNVFEFGDPTHPLQAILVLRDKGAPGPTTLLAWQGSAAATLAALIATTPPQGGGVVAPSIACAKWWTTPAGPLTADLLGEIGGAYVETAPEIAAALVAARSTITVGDVAATKALRPAAAGLHVDDENETAGQALDRLLDGVSLTWVMDPDGTMRFRSFEWGAAVKTLTSVRVARKDTYRPLKQRRLGFQRNQRQHSTSELASYVDDAAVSAAADADAALAQISIMQSDGWLSAGEKPVVIRMWTAIAAEKPGLDAQAAALGVPVTTYDAAYMALSTYLSGLSPAWNNTALDTAIVSATFNGKFTDYYFARTQLINAMAAAAAQALPTVNRVKLSLMEKGTKGWKVRYNPSSLAVSIAKGTFGTNGFPYVQIGATPSAIGQVVSVGTDDGYVFPVTVGERLCVSALVQGFGNCKLSIGYYKPDGTSLPGSAQDIATGTSPAAFTQWFGFVTVPAGAASAYLELYNTSTDSGIPHNSAIQHPMVCSVSSAQALLPPFVPGPNADDGADQTGQNTALDTTNVGGTPSATVLANITSATNLANTANSTAAIGAQLAADVADNSKFSSTEKKRWVEKIGSLGATVTNLVNQGNSLGLQTLTSALNAAWINLNSMLNGYNYTDTAHTTSINSTTFKNTVTAFDNALSALAAGAQDYARIQSQHTTSSLFMDPRFERVTDPSCWGTVDTRAIIQAAQDGRRVCFPSGQSSDVYMNTIPFVFGPNDRLDFECEYYVEPGAVAGNGEGGNFGCWGNVLDANGAQVENFGVITASVAASPKSNWYILRGSYFASKSLSPSKWVISQIYLYIQCQPVTGGSVYIRNPRAYRVTAAQQGLGTNARALSATINTMAMLGGLKLLSNNQVALTQTNASPTVTVNVPAFQWKFDNGLTVSYPSAAITGLAYSTTYYFWRSDPNLDGTGSYGVSTNIYDAQGPDKLYLGYFTTMANTGTGGGGGGGSGGSNPNCVDEDAWVACEGGDKPARDVEPGDRVWCLTDDMKGMELVPVLSNEPAITTQIRIETAGGAKLPLAFDTPMDFPIGDDVRGQDIAANCWAYPIGVWSGASGDPIDWQRALPKPEFDKRTVAKISLGGRTFAASLTKGGPYVLSHNVYK